MATLLTVVCVRTAKVECIDDDSAIDVAIDKDNNIIAVSRIDSHHDDTAFFRWTDIPAVASSSHKEFSLPCRCDAMAFTPDGQHILVCDEDKRKIYRFEAKSPLFQIQEIDISSMWDGWCSCVKLLVTVDEIIFVNEADVILIFSHQGEHVKTISCSVNQYIRDAALVNRNIVMVYIDFMEVVNMDTKCAKTIPFTGQWPKIAAIGDLIAISPFSHKSDFHIINTSGQVLFDVKFDKEWGGMVFTNEGHLVRANETTQTIDFFRLVNKRGSALLLGLHQRAGARGPLLRVAATSSIFDPQALRVALRLAGALGLGLRKRKGK